MKEKIVEYIQGNINSEIVAAEFSFDEDILTTGLIDSIGILKLIAFLDEELNIAVPPEDMTIENFSTINAIEKYAESKSS